jgi:regulator of sigma E protease
MGHLQEKVRRDGIRHRHDPPWRVCEDLGMIDESMDKEQMKQPPQPHEFRSKKSWQRLMIMLGGVFFNFIFATAHLCGGTECLGRDLPLRLERQSTVSLPIPPAMQWDCATVIRSSPLTEKEVDNFYAIIPDILLNDVRRLLWTAAAKWLISRSAVNSSRFCSRILILLMRGSPSARLSSPELPKSHLPLNAGLAAGDEIIALDGNPFNGMMSSRPTSRSARETCDSISKKRGELKDISVTTTGAGILGVYRETPTSWS